MKIACVIPLYDHSATVAGVVANCRKYVDTVLVIDDGSRDLTPEISAAICANGELVTLERNRGKGFALKTAAKILGARNVDYMLTLDADGQHDPDDIPKFLSVLEQRCDCIITGCRDFSVPNVPESSKFGRKFSNFWVKLETGVSCGDTQSGFRAYPVAALNALKLHCDRYNFEIEVLVKLIWAGFEALDVPVNVIYPPGNKRISHFRKDLDNWRLSLLHTALVARRIFGLPAKKLVKRPQENFFKLLLHPKELLRRCLKENSSPEMLAASAAVGTFLAVLPLFSLHMAAIVFVTVKLKLNKIMALAIQNLFMPPLSPLLCIELGHFMRHGRFLSSPEVRQWSVELHLRFWEWLLGSLILAPLFGAISFVCVLAAAKHFQKKRSLTTGE